MIRILFLVLCASLLDTPARGAMVRQAHHSSNHAEPSRSIEIYAHGHKYDSLQAYQASKKAADLSKVKTSQVKHQNLTDATSHQLYVLSVENGLVGALRDFYQTPVGRSISPEQLQGAIAQAVTSSKDPKLLISKPGKLHIMAMRTD